MDDLLPVFVYGTLRNGLGNYRRILEGNTVHEEPATLSGAIMRDAGAFPFVSLDGEDSETVTGEVMHLDPFAAEETMRRLDRLESFHSPGHRANLYDRTQVEVCLSDGTTVTAWTYVTAPGMRATTRGMRQVHSGDWCNRRAHTYS